MVRLVHKTRANSASAPCPSAGLVMNHRAFSVDLDQAPRTHRDGRGGEAIRHAERALPCWQPAHPSRPAYAVWR
jgi:hypothetical protein